VNQYKIHPIVVGTKVFDKGMMTYQHDYGQPYVIPIYTWFIEGGSKTILVDTGEMSPVQSADREAAIGGKIYTFDSGLARWGLRPDDVDIVIHTHLHNDHCENDARCTNARFYVHEKEIQRIHDPHPLDYRYMEDFIEDTEAAGRFEMLSGDTDIVPGIRVVHTPAHTEGGMSVLIDTAQGKALITGFCVIEENFFPPLKVQALDMEVVPPGTPVNVYDSYDIMMRVKTMADILIPLHEPRFAKVDTIPE